MEYILIRPVINPVNIYLFKFNYRNTRKRCEICSKGLLPVKPYGS